MQNLERVGIVGVFGAGPVPALVGDTVFYQVLVQNTGNTALSVTLADAACDAGTLLPATPVTVDQGGTATFSCSHLFTAADVGTFVSTATGTGVPLGVSASPVTASSQATATVSAPATSGVQGATKTVKKVAKKATAPKRAAVKAATFTG